MGAEVVTPGGAVSTDVLQLAADEAVRLLAADGAYVFLLAEDGSCLRWARDAGITLPRHREWVRSLELPFGVGLFGRAFLDRQVVATEDYAQDVRFPHAPGAEEVVTQVGIRAMVAAPLIANAESLGAMGVYRTRPGGFDEAEMGLVGALADHAAAALANARLIEQLARSRGELERLNEELRASEERFRFLLERSPDMVWSTDAEGRFTFVSATSERLTGWRPEELIGRDFWTLVHPSSAQQVARTWAVAIAHPSRKVQYRVIVLHRDGHPVPTEVHAVGIQADGKFAGAQGSLRDLTDRDRLENDLRRRAAERAAEWERANLARELHDSVTQALFSMTLTTRAIEMLLDTDPAAAREKLEELRDLERDALAEMRALIFELRPGSLEQDGLVQALRTHAASVQGRTGLPVIVDADPIERLPLVVESTLYRIGQEALHNIVKHASASQVWMRLDREGGGIHLCVEDDGVGFDPAAVPGGHLGLSGMQARAERVGGSTEVISRAGEGTRVEVWVPAAAIEAAAAAQRAPEGETTSVR